MRTTLQLDDDIVAAARSLAKTENKSMGEVVSDLARKGLAPRPQLATDSGFPVFPVSPEAPKITLEMVQRADEGD